MTPRELAKNVTIESLNYGDIHLQRLINDAICDAVKAEREACAKIADDIAVGCSYDLSSSGDEEGCANRIAEAIRQRKD